MAGSFAQYHTLGPQLRQDLNPGLGLQTFLLTSSHLCPQVASLVRVTQEPELPSRAVGAKGTCGQEEQEQAADAEK